MKALLSRVVGGPETLTIEEIPDPLPGPGQVRLRVRACGVNYPDALFIRDLYQVKWPRPFSPGGEVCGVVEVLGEGVSGLAIGELVVVRCGIGGMASAWSSFWTTRRTTTHECSSHCSTSIVAT